MSKYHNVRCVCDMGGVAHRHDSLAERRRCVTLHLRQQGGEISELARHTAYPLLVGGQRVAVWTDDFSYLQDGARVVEDVKSPATRRETAYRLRKRLVQACLGIDIQEVE